MRLDDNPDRGRKVWLAESEVDQLLNVVEDTDVEIGLRLMVHAGLRTKEALDATPGDVIPMDGDDATGFKLRVWEGKGDKYRETWLPDELANQIRMYADMGGLEADDTLIQCSRRTFLRRLQSARETLSEADDGWQYLSAHDLRRTWGTRAIEAGVLPTVVMQAGGWDDFRTFQKHYMGVHGDRVVSREAAKVTG